MNEDYILIYIIIINKTLTENHTYNDIEWLCSTICGFLGFNLFDVHNYTIMQLTEIKLMASLQN